MVSLIFQQSKDEVNEQYINTNISMVNNISYEEQKQDKNLKHINKFKQDILKKSNQDIIDAILIGTLGLSRILSIHNTKLNLDEVFSSNYRRKRC